VKLLRVFQYLLRKADRRPVHLKHIVLAKSAHDSKDEQSINPPKVSLIIPSRNQAGLLKKCVDSVFQETDYPNLEIIIVNNSSDEPDAITLLDKYRSQGVIVLDYSGEFNYSKICNFAARNASGEFLCLLNNDTQVISRNWLTSMVEHASQDESGVVGALLNYPDDTIQHAGIALGYTGVAGHPYRGQSVTSLPSKHCFQVSAVTFACALISTKKYWQIGGLDESFPSGFNDVEFSLRSTQNGLVNSVCVEARLLHYESRTRPRSFSKAGFIQATKDVLRVISARNYRPTDRFFLR
jgi:GT2 family glycosyltransferase